jgi:glycosyltransferase involved in cell wall biosynthesis
LQLVMAGPEQQDASPWRGLARTLNIAERVTWTGMLSGDVKWGALHAAEVFVLPSHQENFGIAVVEALACGVPVLISREVNIWREIVESGAGLAAIDTVEGTRWLLESWLAKTPGEREQMKSAALRCFTERFEITRASETLLSVLRSGTLDFPAPQRRAQLAFQEGGTP